MAGTLSERLISRLLTRFADRGIRIHGANVAIVPALHPEVGDLHVEVDDDEVTISVGELTHGHFTSISDGAAASVRDEEVVGRVIAFLDAVFDDQVEFWVSDQMGGWHPRGERPLVQWPHVRAYVWSGPVIRP